MTHASPSPFQPQATGLPETALRARLLRRVPGWRGVLSRLPAFGLILLYCICLYILALRFLPAPVTLNMMGSVLSGQTLTRQPVPLERVSPHLVHAVLAAEDSRFCDHVGLDFAAIRSALTHNANNVRRRGGSTISQQTAKNVFFWNGGGYLRKAGEAGMTLLTEAAWGKRRIMEHYLNVAEWGDGLYGAEAAAQARFGKPAADLTLREAALLASVLPNPNTWRLDPPGPYVSRRTRILEQRMRVIRSDGLADCVL